MISDINPLNIIHSRGAEINTFYNEMKKGLPPHESSLVMIGQKTSIM
jgi:hypothetical protein